MKKIAVLLASTLILGSSLAWGEGKRPAGLATVNGVAITAAQVDELVKYIKSEDGNITSDKVLEDLIVKEAINQDVNRLGLLKKPENQLKLKLAQQNIIFDIWFVEYLKKHPITEDVIKAEYDQQLKRSKEARNSKEFNLSQIVLSNEGQANDVIKELSNGASFESVARKRSIHKQSADNGGSLGWVLPAQLISPLGDVVLNLAKDKVSASPVKSAYGWHVIKVNDIRDFVLPPYDQLKNQISSYLLQQRRAQVITELMNKTKVVKN